MGMFSWWEDTQKIDSHQVQRSWGIKSEKDKEKKKMIDQTPYMKPLTRTK